MLSRVADSVHWMNRYVERAENVARFIDVNQSLSLGEAEALQEHWAPLISVSGDEELFDRLYDARSRENVLSFLVFDQRNPNSIRSCLGSARENARTVREVISSSMWEEINKFYLMANETSEQAVIDQPYAFCHRVKLASHTLVGITDATMSHNEAWHFARIGRLLERADKTSRMIDVQYFLLLPSAGDIGGSLDVVRWTALLRSTSALEMYRRTHGRIEPARVADFLVLDREFPRSIHFCLIKAHASLREITGRPEGTFKTRSEQQLGRLQAEFDFTSISDVLQGGMHEFVDGFQARLNAVSDAICGEFFQWHAN